MDKLIKASLIASVVTIGWNMEKKESEKENSPKEEQNILEEQIIKEIEEHDAELEKGLLEKKESGEIEPKEKGTNEVSSSKTVLACCNNCLRRFDPQENAREVTKEEWEEIRIELDKKYMGKIRNSKVQSPKK